MHLKLLGPLTLGCEGSGNCIPPSGDSEPKAWRKIGKHGYVYVRTIYDLYTQEVWMDIERYLDDSVHWQTSHLIHRP